MDQRILQIIQNHPELKSEFEELYPELKESEDERIRKAIVYAIGQSSHYDGTLINGVFSEEALAWLERQKPAEWNPTNEDVILFNKAVTTNTTLTSDERAKLDIIRMKFKHCPVIKQQEQKPVGWSEENEAKIHFLKNLIQYQVRDEDYCFGHNGKDYISKQEAISMLDSLRPSWKPSEEQMEALRVYLYHPQYIDNSEDIRIKLVESLYNDLQKLL